MTNLVKGIGPVHLSMILSFIMGIYIVYLNTGSGNNLIQILGFISLIVGIVAMFGKTAIKGVAGGLLTGLGLGVTAAPYILPTIIPFLTRT
jgi:hypothetical protein